MSPERTRNPIRRIINRMEDAVDQILLGVPRDISERQRELSERGEAPPGPRPKYSTGEGRPTFDYPFSREKDWEKTREYLGIPRKSKGNSAGGEPGDRISVEHE